MKLLLVLFVVFLCVVQAKENDLYFNAGLIGMSMDYREYDDNEQILDSEKSDISQMMGVEFGVSYVLNAADGDYSELNAAFERITGKTDYVGAYLGSGEGYGSLKSTTHNTSINFDANYIYGLSLNESWHILLGAAFGYRSWERALMPNQMETYSWAYAAPKLGAAYVQNLFKLTLMTDYRYAVSPKMTATGIRDEFKLGSANAFEGSVKGNYSLTQKVAIYAAYIYEYQKIEKSNVLSGSGYFEPDSRANNQYIKFGLTFKY